MSKEKLGKHREVRPVFLFILALVVMTIAFVLSDLYNWKRIKSDDIVSFQRMTGGLGMGAICAPVWNFINFDMRIQPIDDSITWPLPGGYSYGPDRTGTVSYFEEIPSGRPLNLIIEIAE